MLCRAKAEQGSAPGTLEYDLEQREKAMKGKRGKPKEGRARRPRDTVSHTRSASIRRHQAFALSFR